MPLSETQQITRFPVFSTDTAILPPSGVYLIASAVASIVRVSYLKEYGFFTAANHDESAFPQHFLIESEGKSIFYGCDGAWLLNKTYYHLHKRHLDVAVFDCTTGDYEGEWRIGEHNGIPMLRVMLPSLKSVEAITDKTKVYFSHLAPSLHKSHDETEKIAHTLGAFVAYDGLCIEA